MSSNLHNPLLPGLDIEGLIFDLDGTLADTMTMHIDSWRSAGESYGKNITEQMIHERAGTPTIHIVEEFNQLFGWSIDPQEFIIRKTAMYLELKKLQGPIQPITSVMAIAELYRGKMPMSVGTGSIRTNAEAALSDLGITDWFEIMVTSEDVVHPKPHPETFLRCAKAMGVSPEKCLVYEDGQMGINAALSGGMSAIHIQTLEKFHP